MPTYNTVIVQDKKKFDSRYHVLNNDGTHCYVELKEQSALEEVKPGSKSYKHYIDYISKLKTHLCCGALGRSIVDKEIKYLTSSEFELIYTNGMRTYKVLPDDYMSMNLSGYKWLAVAPTETVQQEHISSKKVLTPEELAYESSLQAGLKTEEQRLMWCKAYLEGYHKSNK